MANASGAPSRREVVLPLSSVRLPQSEPNMGLLGVRTSQHIFFPACEVLPNVGASACAVTVLCCDSMASPSSSSTSAKNRYGSLGVALPSPTPSPPCGQNCSRYVTFAHFSLLFACMAAIVWTFVLCALN